MFIKIFQHIEKKCFGDKFIVYQGKNRNESIYIAVVKDRDEIVNFIIDNELKYMYPCMVPEFIIDLNNPPENIDFCMDIDLTRYGKSRCPISYQKLIQKGKSNYWFDFVSYTN